MTNKKLLEKILALENKLKELEERQPIVINLPMISCQQAHCYPAHLQGQQNLPYMNPQYYNTGSPGIGL